MPFPKSFPTPKKIHLSLLPNHFLTSEPRQPTCCHLISNMLLSRFSRVQLCATPAHPALPSLGFSRQEHWSGLPFPSPMRESEKWKGSRVQLLLNPMDCSLPGSSIHGIFQARVLEWGTIAFSKILAITIKFWFYAPKFCKLNYLFYKHINYKCNNYYISWQTP